MAERPWKLNDTFPLSLAMEEEAAASVGSWTLNDTLPLSLAQTFTAAAGESAGEFWSLWEQSFNEAEAGGPAEIFAAGAATLVFTADGTAVLPIAAAGARSLVLAGAGQATSEISAIGAATIQLQGDGTAVLPIAAQGAGTLQLAGDGTATLGIEAQGAGVIALIGAGTVDLEELEPEVPELPVPYGAGGAGREEFQPRYRRRPRAEPTEARGAGKLVLIGRGRVHLAPEAVKAGISVTPKQRSQKERPPEELREFRILARGRGRLQLVGQGEARADIRGAGRGFLALHGAGRYEQSWPDDTAEHIAIMLLLDTDAA